VSLPVFVVTGDDDAETAEVEAGVRAQIAFYGSTPAYRAVLDLHGWGDLHERLHELSRAGDWDAMPGRSTTRCCTPSRSSPSPTRSVPDRASATPAWSTASACTPATGSTASLGPLLADVRAG
jgi:hypothetical protein